MSSNFLIRPSEPADIQPILATFAHVFRDSRSKDVWQWIYRDNPDESRSMVCLIGDGRVAAHSGASFHRAVYEGDIVRIGQCRDSFSHPKFRSVMRERVGLFAQTTQSLFAQYGTAEGVTFYYGFPSPKHLRLGSKQLNYREGNNWRCLHYDTRKLLPIFGNMYGSLTAKSNFGIEFDRLWSSREKDMKLAVIHDSRFLSWRFHPRLKRNYWVWAFTPYLSTEIKGYVIFTQRGNKAMLLDLHFPTHPRACLDFWVQVVEKLRWHGIEEIETWLSFNHPDLAKLYELGFLQCALPKAIRFCFRELGGGPNWETLNEKFYFTMADSDLY